MRRDTGDAASQQVPGVNRRQRRGWLVREICEGGEPLLLGVLSVVSGGEGAGAPESGVRWASSPIAGMGKAEADSA
jgi:hypothetical protein